MMIHKHPIQHPCGVFYLCPHETCASGPPNPVVLRLQVHTGRLAAGLPRRSLSPLRTFSFSPRIGPRKLLLVNTRPRAKKNTFITCALLLYFIFFQEILSLCCLQAVRPPHGTCGTRRPRESRSPPDPGDRRELRGPPPRGPQTPRMHSPREDDCPSLAVGAENPLSALRLTAVRTSVPTGRWQKHTRHQVRGTRPLGVQGGL